MKCNLQHRGTKQHRRHIDPVLLSATRNVGKWTCSRVLKRHFVVLACEAVLNFVAKPFVWEHNATQHERESRRKDGDTRFAEVWCESLLCVFGVVVIVDVVSSE
jgi:hypothetical protein